MNSHPARLTWAALAFLLAPEVARGQGSDPKASFHGAASHVQQLAALERLGLPLDGLTAPAGIDPTVGTASIVPGHEPTAERMALGKRLTAGARIFHSGDELGSTIAVSCDMRHPDAANTHPETYPKYQTQIGKLRDMVNDTP